VDFAVFPDGNILYMSDLLEKSIVQFRRQGSGNASPRTNTVPTPAAAATPKTGWIVYSDAGWENAIQQGTTIIALYHHDDTPESEKFLNGILSSPETKGVLGKLPSFSYKAGSKPAPKYVAWSSFGTAPELLLMGSAGQRLARFNRQSSAQEIAATLKVLGVK
jgi:hypothetical protein